VLASVPCPIAFDCAVSHMVSIGGARHTVIGSERDETHDLRRSDHAQVCDRQPVLPKFVDASPFSRRCASMC
jgi:hypothetical protein